LIITENKPFEEVKAVLDDFKVKKVIIASCGVCAAKVGTGGTEGAAAMEKKLKENGYEVLSTVVVDEPCDNRMSRQALKKLKVEFEKSDAVVSLACGIGSQSIAKTAMEMGKPVITALNTIFMGETERIGRFFERCRACGQCLLNETGGVCPVAMCAKSMLNGPCGGQIEGKCEVGKYTRACGWVEIYKALKSINRLDLFVKIRQPRDWTNSGHQRELLLR
jgi:rRNA maturation endonuclease Nob1